MFACCGSRHDKSGRPPGCFGTWMADEYIPSWEAGGVKGRGFRVSWQLASQGLSALAGALTGALLYALLPQASLESWGWRLPFLLGLLTNYVLSIAWVFSKRNVGSPWAEFAVFAVIGVVGLGMNELILWGLTGGLGLYYPVSKLVSTAVVFGWNFGARKLALFS